MIRYVCDVCGTTADEALPGTWTTAQVSGGADAGTEGAPPPAPVTRHACPAHPAGTMFGGAKT